MRCYLNCFLLCAAIFSGGLVARAQVFGGNPPSQKWRQLNTSQVRVIFPRGMDSIAHRIAVIAQRLDAQTLGTIGEERRKVNIVLQNQTTISNGYVQLAPYRSEFFMMPFQSNVELGTLAWHEGLAIHEYRHIQQYSNFNKGLSKALHFLLGEQGQTLANNTALPDWFWEGDAVYQETIVSEQGRGRTPFFFNGYRSLWLDKKNYSWEKLRNGSYRDFVPDHYQLGYLLIAYGRQQYGDDFWRKVTSDAVAFKGLFYPFQQAIKKHAGIEYKEFVKNALAYYSRQINAEKTGGQAVDIPKSKHYQADYLYPQLVNADSLVVLKKSFTRIPAFYLKTNSGEKKIRVKDISNDDYFSYRNGKIVYAAFEPDARWGWRNYSVLKVIDVLTGTQTRLTRQSRYFAPDIAADGQQVVAVDVATNGAASLHILDATGKLLKAVPNTGNYFYSHPKFLGTDKILAALRLPDGRTGIAITGVEDGETDWLTPPGYNVVDYPTVKGDTVFFSAAYQGHDNIYAVLLKDRRVFRLTHTAYGSYQPFALGNQLVWNIFAANGRMLQKQDITGMDWKEIPPGDMQAIQMHYLEKEKHHIVPAVLSATTEKDAFTASDGPVRKYAKGTGLLNFHSWRPFFSNPDISFTIYGENILNTLLSELSYTFNTNERSHTIGCSATYAGWFPQVSVGVNTILNRSRTDSSGTRTWNEVNAFAGITIPLNFSSGRSFRSMSLSSTFVLDQLYYNGISKNVFSNKRFTYLQHGLQFSNQLQRAQMQLFPALAQSFSLQYRHALTQFTANQWLGRGSLIFPGLWRTHGLVISGAAQGRDTLRQHFFTNNFPFSRGYVNVVDAPRMYKLGVNYSFPLLYPEWGFGNIFYLLRVRGNAFYDYTTVKFGAGLRQSRDFKSAGGEIFFDTKWWNQFPVSVGVRYSRLLDEPLPSNLGRHQWEFVLPVALF
jgi:hypothetical protein